MADQEVRLKTMDTERTISRFQQYERVPLITYISGEFSPPFAPE